MTSPKGTAAEIVSYPYLREVLHASAQTRDLCMALADTISSSPVTSSQAQPSPEIQDKISQQQKLLFTQLATLRGENRNALLNVRETKQKTAEARQEVDRLHLQLQNLYYEERHLRGEIAACESYDHQYQQLPLIAEDEFLDLKPEVKDLDPKEIMFARIQHELAEREALEQQRQGLLKQKQGLIADNKKRKEDLASLDRDLETFIDAAKPIIKTFEKHA